MDNNIMYANRMADEPVLMPYQTLPFNGDTFVEEEFLKLKERFNLSTAIEGGSCVGGTTKWLGENFNTVHSIEINEQFLSIAIKRCRELSNVNFYRGSTSDLLLDVLKKCDNNTIFFSDAHWNENFPMFDELISIRDSGLKPVLAIHDFLVPDEPLLGFDSYNGIDISFQNIKRYIDDIYGESGYDYHYNKAETSTDVKRGLIYIYPKKA